MKTHRVTSWVIFLILLADLQIRAAGLVTGSIGFVGSVTYDTSSAGTATEVTSWVNPEVSPSTPTGSFAGIVTPGNLVSFTNSAWTLNDSTIVSPFWSVDGFKFELISSSITAQSSSSPGQPGYVIVSGTGIISGNGFSPNLMYFSFTSQDPESGSNPDSWFFSASASSSSVPQPIANSQIILLFANGSPQILLTGSDPNHLPLTFVISTSPNHGALTGFNTNTGVVSYTPDSNYFGTDSFAFYVSNAFTNSSIAQVTLNINSMGILQQPLNEVITNGGTTTFTATGGGVGPFDYQWLFNGAFLIGATNVSLSISNAKAESAGIYSVKLSNPYSSITSSNAILQIVPPGSVFWVGGNGDLEYTGKLEHRCDSGLDQRSCNWFWC